jgi:hypothetical protein
MIIITVSPYGMQPRTLNLAYRRFMKWYNEANTEEVRHLYFHLADILSQEHDRQEYFPFVPINDPDPQIIVHAPPLGKYSDVVEFYGRIDLMAKIFTYLLADIPAINFAHDILEALDEWDQDKVRPIDDVPLSLSMAAEKTGYGKTAMKVVAQQKLKHGLDL